MYLYTHHRTEEFIITLANYLVICTDHIFSFKNFIIDDINYQLNFSIYVATEGHCYATLGKTDIHLIGFDRLAYREIQLITLTLMTSSKARAPEMRMITRDSY